MDSVATLVAFLAGIRYIETYRFIQTRIHRTDGDIGVSHSVALVRVEIPGI